MRARTLRSFKFDRAFTSVLARATETLRLVLETVGQTGIPIEKDKALNERMYGELQGLNKAETAKSTAKNKSKFGDAVTTCARRGESLKDTAERVLPYYERTIKPYLLKGEAVLVSAHGNSLRALIMELEQLSREQVLELNIPTGRRCSMNWTRRGRSSITATSDMSSPHSFMKLLLQARIRGCTPRDEPS